METKPRVLIISQRKLKRFPGYGPFYEFEESVEDLADADRVDLSTSGIESIWIRTSQRVNSALRLATGGRIGNGGPLPGAADAILRKDYDLALFVCVDFSDIRLLNLVRGLRERSQRVAVFVPEHWSTDYNHYRTRLLPYRIVDHIFVGFDDLVGPISQASGCPTTALPIAVNATRFRPTRSWNERIYDVCWTGRRMKPMHEDLMRLVTAHGWRYYFDTLSNGQFDDLQEQRTWLAALLGDSRFAIAHYSRVTQPEITKGQRQLGGRFMESAAAGNVLVGAAPTTPQFHSCMPWQDAVIPVAEDESRVDRILLQLASDPERMNAISRRNVAGTLRHNDWAHRWATVLEAMRMPATPGLNARLSELEAEASAWDPDASDATNVAATQA